MMQKGKAGGEMENGELQTRIIIIIIIEGLTGG